MTTIQSKGLGEINHLLIAVTILYLAISAGIIRPTSLMRPKIIIK
tara:strand:- start:19 stop:153 length:135 start_codon:yes stop_codon:yes gene_type:complete